MTEGILQCAYCGTDFVKSESYRGPQKYCKTARCRADRQMEKKAKTYERAVEKFGKVNVRPIMGKDPTVISHRVFCRVKRKRGEET